jgi:hypothetical protein
MSQRENFIEELFSERWRQKTSYSSSRTWTNMSQADPTA